MFENLGHSHLIFHGKNLTEFPKEETSEVLMKLF